VLVDVPVAGSPRAGFCRRGKGGTERGSAASDVPCAYGDLSRETDTYIYIFFNIFTCAHSQVCAREKLT